MTEANRLVRGVAAALLLGSVGLAQTDGPVKLGLGSYATQPPPGGKEPPATQFKTDGVRPPLPTNTWWSSLLWEKFSSPQYAHPLVLQATVGGMKVYHPKDITVSPRGLFGAMPAGGRDLVLGHSEAPDFPDARLDGWSDWFVTAAFISGKRAMRVSYGHGSPFVFALYEAGSPKITFTEPPKVWSGNSGSAVLGVTIGGKHYGLFAPTGSSWTGLEGKVLTCDTKGKAYFSVAVLPDASAKTLELFQQYAYCHVTGTKVEWSYDQKTGVLTTRFGFTTKAQEGKAAGTLFAIYPHQWRNTSDKLLEGTYQSVRGVMKLGAGESFTTKMTFPGLLPVLPEVAADAKEKLKGYVQDEVRPPASGPRDTYWEGKHLGKLACLAAIAEQVGDAPASQRFLSEIKRRLEGWLSALDDRGQAKKTGLFCYNRAWGTLIGYPGSYGSDTELNDHHFHYGYFLKAAAEIARTDPAWASDKQWGAMLRLVIRDIACADRGDPMFPFLRAFDVYAGHSWASGSARFGDGNNQESSSESMNAWAAIILLAVAIGDRDLRDLGIYLYTTEMNGIEEYWFDVHGQNRPAAYKPPTVAMVWGGKSVYETWFSGKGEMVQGINWLPIHGGSLYLGRYPQFVRKSYDALVGDKGAAALSDWVDLVLMYRALDDPQDAMRQFNARQGNPPMEGGNTKANLYHWLTSLQVLGRVDRTVTADYPLYAVFRGASGRAYVVYNMDDRLLKVTFSDGATVDCRAKGFTVHREAGR
jgi:endoglucanase Acf2